MYSYEVLGMQAHPSAGQSGYGANAAPWAASSPSPSPPSPLGGQDTPSWSAAPPAATPPSAATPWSMPKAMSEGRSASMASSQPHAAPWSTGASPSWSPAASSPRPAWDLPVPISGRTPPGKADPLADLWKSSSANGAPPAPAAKFPGPSTPAKPPPALNPLWGAPPPPEPSIAKETKGYDPFASLTGQGTVSMAAMKKAKEEAALQKAHAQAAAATAAAAVSDSSGYDTFSMAGMYDAVGDLPTAAHAQTVRIRVETVEVEVGEIGGGADEYGSASFLSDPPPSATHLQDPFGDMFGAPPAVYSVPAAYAAPSSSAAAEAGDFDDFQSSAPLPSAGHSEQSESFSGYSGYTPTMEAAADPFAATQDPFASPAGQAQQGEDPFAVFGGPGGSPAAAAPMAPASDPFATVFGAAATSTPAPPSSDPFATIFGAAASAGSSQPKPSTSPAVDPLEALLFQKKPSPSAAATSASPAAGGGEDWGVSWGDFQEGGTTRELEGVGPPPPGVSAASALAKGSSFFKGGQFADAIKWLMWAEQLCQASGDRSQLVEVLTTRATCYKEAGEMKKAVTDCSAVGCHTPGHRQCRLTELRQWGVARIHESWEVLLRLPACQLESI